MPRLRGQLAHEIRHGARVADIPERFHTGGAHFLVVVVQRRDERLQGGWLSQLAERSRGFRTDPPAAIGQLAHPSIHQAERRRGEAELFDDRAAREAGRRNQQPGEQRPVSGEPRQLLGGVVRRVGRSRASTIKWIRARRR